MNRKTLQAALTAMTLLATPAFAKAKKPKATPPAAPTVPAREDLKHVPPDRGHSQPEAPAAKPSVAPQKFVEGLYERMNTLSKAAANLDALHAKIGEELKSVVDYPEMARLALGQKWLEIDDAQKNEFVGHLKGMVLNTYVKRFKPGQAVDIKYGATKNLPEDRALVATTITVGKTTAEVSYGVRPGPGRWLVYDIIVDEASQVQTYRQSFKKILDKEGWPGLMTRMKKAAEKKV